MERQDETLDSFLRLEDLTGATIKEDDDSASNTNAVVYFQPGTAGTVRLIAMAYDKDRLGKYKCTIRAFGEPPPPTPLTIRRGFLSISESLPPYPGIAVGRKDYWIKLDPKQIYIIDMIRRDNIDPILALQDDSGKEVARNDDVEPGRDLNSRIIYRPTQAGMYRLIATCTTPGDRGYTLVIREQ